MTRMRDPVTGAMARKRRIPMDGSRSPAFPKRPSMPFPPAAPRSRRPWKAGESPEKTAGNAAAWAAAHLAERQSVFGHAELVAATLSRDPGAVSLKDAERAISDLNKQGTLHLARGLEQGRHWTTDAAIARESETIALMRAGQGVANTIMRPWVLKAHLHKSKLNEGQQSAIESVLSTHDRIIGIQGYAGTGKTTMLSRLRALVEKRGYRPIGLAPSASAAKPSPTNPASPSKPCNAFWRGMKALPREGEPPKACKNSAPSMQNRYWWWTNLLSLPANRCGFREENDSDSEYRCQTRGVD